MAQTAEERKARRRARKKMNKMVNKAKGNLIEEAKVLKFTNRLYFCSHSLVHLKDLPIKLFNTMGRKSISISQVTSQDQITVWCEPVAQNMLTREHAEEIHYMFRVMGAEEHQLKNFIVCLYTKDSADAARDALTDLKNAPKVALAQSEERIHEKFVNKAMAESYQEG